MKTMFTIAVVLITILFVQAESNAGDQYWNSFNSNFGNSYNSNFGNSYNSFYRPAPIIPIQPVPVYPQATVQPVPMPSYQMRWTAPKLPAIKPVPNYYNSRKFRNFYYRY